MTDSRESKQRRHKLLFLSWERGTVFIGHSSLVQFVNALAVDLVWNFFIASSLSSQERRNSSSSCWKGDAAINWPVASLPLGLFTSRPLPVASLPLGLFTSWPLPVASLPLRLYTSRPLYLSASIPLGLFLPLPLGLFLPPLKARHGLFYSRGHEWRTHPPFQSLISTLVLGHVASHSLALYDHQKLHTNSGLLRWSLAVFVEK